jgi:hypothetical protein
MNKNEVIKNLLICNPYALADEIMGDNNKEVSEVFSYLLNSQHFSIKNHILNYFKDTYLAMKKDDCLDILNDLGFRLVWDMNYHNTIFDCQDEA